MTSRTVVATLVLAASAQVAHTATGAVPDASVSLSATELLARVADTCRTCLSYTDTGLVRKVLHGNGQHTQGRPFQTVFVRPYSFRFEFSNTLLESRYVVLREGETLDEWWSIQPCAAPSPSLLLTEEISGRRLTEMTEAKRLPDVDCGTSVCARVEGISESAKRVLWIDPQSFLLRRIEPFVNQPVSPGQLSFDRPSTKRSCPTTG